MNPIKKLPGIRKILNKFNLINSKMEYLEHEIIHLQCELNRQKHITKFRDGKKIIIVFVCHRPQVWNTLKPLFEACLDDSDFEVTIVAIPVKKQLTDLDFNHEFYESEGAEEFWKNVPCKVINGYDYEKREWFDLKTLAPDYVFFQQPYNVAKCEHYKSWRVSEYATVCYTSYYYTISHTDVTDCMPKDFIQNVSLCFMQNSDEYNWFNKRFDYLNYSNVKRFLTGCPRFDYLSNYKNIDSPLWKLKKEDSFRVVWTPRWTTNENTCHFFDYKDYLVDYCGKHEDVDFVFRPHPQAKLNYAAENNFSVEEFEKYELLYEKSNNMTIDKTADFLPLFYSADVLISDFSSVIPEFFLTGKPIIYCKKDNAICDIEASWINGMYCARNWNEVEKLLEQLRTGDDPLKSIRQEYIKSEFVFSPKGAGVEMKEIIKRDFSGE